jgi:hypothetical protein
MTSLKTKKLLKEVSRTLQKERETFSRQEIVKKMNEIKYLSKQKKVPKLSLQKEIRHLEKKLSGVFELEQKMLKNKKSESSKVAILKKQINQLKKRLAANEQKDLHKKVEKLSHLLGELMAKQETKTHVNLNKKVQRKSSKSKSKPVSKQKPTSTNNSNKAIILQERLEALKEEMEANPQLSTKNPKKAQLIEKNIVSLQEKLNQCLGVAKNIPTAIKTKMPDSGDGQIKHKMLFEAPPSPVEDETIPKTDLDDELPMPPPPKIKK